MGIDILVLRVLCLLCGGATEIPRLDAPARPNLLRGFAVNQTQSPGPNRTSSGPGWDAVWTGFFYHLPAPPSPQPQSPQPFPQNPVPRAFFLSPAPIRPTHRFPCIKCINLQHFQNSFQTQTPAHLSTYAHPLRPTVARPPIMPI